MIVVGSEWQNECGIKVKVISVKTVCSMDIVIYYSGYKGHVSTVDDFVVCYKPFEPLHESKYAYMFDGELHVTPMYLTKDEAKNAGFTEDQRITISTRERKQ